MTLKVRKMFQSMKKELMTLLVALIAGMGCHAHAASRINGLLIDANDTTPLVSATVKLFKVAKDSAFVAGVVTDSHGVFNLPDVTPGHYVVKCSYLGYAETTRRVNLAADGRGVNLGAIPMTMEGKLLTEVVVHGVKTAVTVKEDTIEYNADTYKTQANAVVEDLLKRMPGVEVSSDGKITANGKEVTKILIDGKEFFSDDPTVASKNIPADMVNKLQLIDRKSDLARLTGVDDGEDETVINLTVKKEMNNGWFGTANAGYGTDDRYAANVIANHFSNGNQFTLVGSGNNTNNIGFTDGGKQRFRRFGGDQGITTSQNVGLNFNVGTNDGGGDGEQDRFRAGGDLMYSHSDRDTRTSTARQYLFTDSTSYADATTSARDKSHDLRGDFRLKWMIDTCNVLEFRPNFSLNFGKSARADSSMTRAGDALNTLVNRSVSDYLNDGESCEFGAQLVYTHKFKFHPGRSYSVQVRYNYSKVNEDGNTLTQNRYYLKDGEDETIDQMDENRRHTHGVNGRLTWTEPLGNIKNARFLTVAYRGNYRYNRASKMVYDIARDAVQPVQPVQPVTLGAPVAGLPRSDRFSDYMARNYDDGVLTDDLMLASILNFGLAPALNHTLNEEQSSQFSNTYYNQSLRVGFRQVRKAYNLNVGLSVSAAMSKSEDVINGNRSIPARWAWSVAPFARLRYKFSKTRNLAFDYRMRSSQPSIGQLQPVPDTSNPLNIVIGNPGLRPTFTHRVNLRFNDFNQLDQRSVMAMMAVRFSQNSIISKTTYDSSTGGRYTTYDNVNGVWNAFAMNMLNFPFTSSKVMFFTSHVMGHYAVAKGYNNTQYNRSQTFTLSLSPGLAFRNEVFDLEIRPRYRFQTTHNSLAAIGGKALHTYGGMFNGTISAPCGLVLSTDLTYSASTGYASGYNNTQWLWNASLGYEFLAGRKASLQLSVYDLLKQKKSVYRNVTAGYIEDAAYNALTRYAMLTFTYRFTTFKNGHQPELRDGFGSGQRHGGRHGGGGHGHF